MISDVIIGCSDCDFEGEIDINEFTIDIDIPNQRYIFNTTCPSCGEPISDSLHAGAIKL